MDFTTTLLGDENLIIFLQMLKLKLLFQKCFLITSTAIFSFMSLQVYSGDKNKTETASFVNSGYQQKKNKMAADMLKNPRKKKGAKKLPKESPFPVPIQSITNKECCDSRWFYYTGYFRDNCVVVEDLGDLTFLYKMVSNQSSI